MTKAHARGDGALPAHAGDMAVACSLGAIAGWSLTAAGALAPTLAAAYGTGLTTVGIFTASFGAAYVVSQLPAGALVDRFGAKHGGIVGSTVVMLAHLGAAWEPHPGLATTGRLMAGVGAALCYVAGAEMARASGSGAVGQGYFGGAVTGAGGGALITVPAAASVVGWRSAWLTCAALALIGFTACCMKTPVVHEGAGRRRVPNMANTHGVLLDRHLLHLSAVHAATFGVGIVLSNWASTILQRSWDMRESTANAVASIALLTTVVSRPLGGYLVRRYPPMAPTLVYGALATTALGSLALLQRGPTVVSAGGMLLLGLAVGLPFATVFAAAQLRRPDQPALATGMVNSMACLVIVLGTPIFGAAVDAGHTDTALVVTAVASALPLLGCSSLHHGRTYT